MASLNEEVVSHDVVATDKPMQNDSFVICPANKNRPTGRDAAKQSDAEK